jgi:hypothetical protein
MACKKLSYSELHDFAAARTSLWSAWITNRHLNRCNDCSAAYTSIKPLIGNLAAASEASPPDQVWLAIQSQIIDAKDNFPVPNKRSKAVPQLAVISMTTTLFIAGIAVGVHQLNTRPPKHIAKYDFSRYVKLGAPLAPFTFGHRLDLDVTSRSLETVRLTQAERREGIAFNAGSAMGAMPQDFSEAAAWAKKREENRIGISEANSDIYTVYGCDNSAQFYWFVRGAINATMTCSDGSDASADACVVSLKTEKEMRGYVINPNAYKVPKIEITNGAKTFLESGYGTRTYFSADHRKQITLKIWPLGQSPPSLLIMVGETQSNRQAN